MTVGLSCVKHVRGKEKRRGEREGEGRMKEEVEQERGGEIRIDGCR